MTVCINPTNSVSSCPPVVLANYNLRVIVRGIVGIRNVNGRIDDWDVVLFICDQTINELLAFIVRESIWIIDEVSVLKHVIDVGPDVLEWNLEFAVGIHDILQHCPIASIYVSTHALIDTIGHSVDSPVLVAPTALMETKSPVLLHCRESDGTLLVLSRNSFRCWAVEEKEINATSKSTPGDIGRPQQCLHALILKSANEVSG